MKKSTILVAAVLLAGWPFLSGTAQSHPAKLVVDWIWDHLGGKARFERARYVEFTWAWEEEGRPGGSRKHTWDRYSGDYVLEWKAPKTNDDIKVYFNVESKRGVALVNGARVEDDEAETLIESAYRMFVNDTYWLLVPTKLEDYGSHITYDGHEGGEGGNGEDSLVILRLFFDEGVGLTPGDRYWLYVTHSGRIVRWRYVLEGGHEGEWEWTDEKDCGMGLVFATRKVTADGKRAIVFPEVRFSDAMAPAVFEYTANP